MLVDVADTQYAVVRSAATRLGWTVLDKGGVLQPASPAAGGSAVDGAGAGSAVDGDGAGSGAGDASALGSGHDGVVDIKWHDGVIKPTDLTTIRSTGVRWNHFSGIESLCTKCGMQQTLGRLADRHPKEFKFMPRSWTLPVQKIKLQHYMETKGARIGVTLIVKPNTSSRGRGMFPVSPP